MANPLKPKPVKVIVDECAEMLTGVEGILNRMTPGNVAHNRNNALIVVRYVAERLKGVSGRMRGPKRGKRQATPRNAR